MPITDESIPFARKTDDGVSFYDERFISTGGSSAWLSNLQGTLSSRVL